MPAAASRITTQSLAVSRSWSKPAATQYESVGAKGAPAPQLKAAGAAKGGEKKPTAKEMSMRFTWVGRSNPNP